MNAPSGHRPRSQPASSRPSSSKLAGAAVYRLGDADLLDGYGADEMSTSGRGQVLMPWPNRLEGGSYEFRGRRHQLPLDEPDAGNAIHGFVRWESWTVAEREPNRVVMRHEVQPAAGLSVLARPVDRVLALAEPDFASRRRRPTSAPSHARSAAGAHPYLTIGTEQGQLGRPRRLPRVRTVLHANARGIPTGRAAVHGTERDRLPAGEADRRDATRPRVHRPRAGRGRSCPRRAPAA